MLLKYQPDVPACSPQLMRPHLGDRAPEPQDPAAIGLRQPGQATEQRCLAGPAGPEQRDDLAAPDSETDVVEDAPAGITLSEADNFDCRGVGQISLRRSQALSWSTAVTMPRMIRITVATLGKSSRSTAFLRSWPIPPAPTSPSTVEERMLNSQI